MEQWITYKLGKIAECSLGKMLDQRKNKGKPQMYLGNIAVRWGSFNINPSQTMLFEDHELTKYKLEINDIVICEGGEPGRCAMWKSKDTIYIQKALHRVRVNRNIADPFYVYYYITYLVKSHLLDSYFTGTTIKHLPREQLLSIDIKMPNLATQKKIGNILETIDSKIDLNRRITDNLEQQAQALYDYYFSADSKYLSDSERGVLTNIAVYLNGLAMQKFPPTDSEHSLPVLKIKELGQGKCDNNSDRCSNDIDSNYVIDNGNIIFSWSGTLMVDVWCGGKCGLNQHLFKVTPLQDYPQWFIYYWTIRHLNTFKLIAKDKAVTMGHIKRVDLEKAEVIIPNKYSLVEMNAQIEPLYQSIINNRLQIAELETLRDALLPKLMSGELKINDLNC